MSDLHMSQIVTILAGEISISFSKVSKTLQKFKVSGVSLKFKKKHYKLVFKSNPSEKYIQLQ